MLIIGSVPGQGAEYDTVLKGDISDFDRGEECRRHCEMMDLMLIAACVFIYVLDGIDY
jgi:hypothetical protein